MGKFSISNACLFDIALFLTAIAPLFPNPFSQVSAMPCIEEEREALLQLKGSFVDPSNRLISWKGTDCCSWDGVACNQTSGRVIMLDLQNGDQVKYSTALLSRGIDSSLLKLKFLNYLDLSGNFFNYSQIPNFLSSMVELRYLNLSHASFYGRVPPSLGNLSNLVALDFNDVYFYNGRYVSWLFIDNSEWIHGLSSLQYIDLSGVNLAQASNSLQVLNTLPSLLISKLRLSSLQNIHLSYVSLNSSFLPKIQLLALSHNMFNCSLPQSFQNMSSIRYLDLSHNGFRSSIPFWLAQLKNLKYLNLINNLLYGPIPAAFGNLSSIEYLFVSHNMLTGGVPSTIGKLVNLRELHLRDNRLDGIVADSLGQLQSLEVLDISGNFLKGVVSEVHFRILSKLHTVWMGGNTFLSLDMKSNWVPPFQLKTVVMGPCKGFGTMGVPQWFQTQKQLVYLNLANTNISGPIPKWLGGQNLKALDLSFNNITGPLPESIGDQMPNLWLLNLQGSQINGFLPQSLCKMKYLGILFLSTNRLSGAILGCLFTPNLIALDLSSNNFSGIVQIPMGNFSRLRQLVLVNNSLEGNLPSSLRSCSSLGLLNLQGNRFSGNIPTWVGERLGNLQVLILRDNMFDGNIPSSISLLSILNILDLAHNRLVGNIPPSLGNLSVMAGTKRIEQQWFVICVGDNTSPICYFRQYSLPIKSRNDIYSTTQLNLMLNMDFSGNKLVGHIPSEMTALKALIALNLSQNYLSGTIPAEIENMKSLESLDLSFNQLSGQIPTGISKLDSLGVLKLSNNNFHGRIPRAGHLLTLNDPSTFDGNPNLCGEPLPIKCLGDKTSEPSAATTTTADDAYNHDGREWNQWEKMIFYLMIISGYIIGFWGVVGALIFKRNWRYAYFQFMDEIKDNIYVAVLLNVRKLKRRMNRNEPLE